MAHGATVKHPVRVGNPPVVPAPSRAYSKRIQNALQLDKLVTCRPLEISFLNSASGPFYALNKGDTCPKAAMEPIKAFRAPIIACSEGMEDDDGPPPARSKLLTECRHCTSASAADAHSIYGVQGRNKHGSALLRSIRTPHAQSTRTCKTRSTACATCNDGAGAGRDETRTAMIGLTHLMLATSTCCASRATVPAAVKHCGSDPGPCPATPLYSCSAAQCTRVWLRTRATCARGSAGGAGPLGAGGRTWVKHSMEVPSAATATSY